MCGISGFIARYSTPEALPLVRSMNQLLAHRGQDDEGFFACNGEAFKVFGSEVSCEKSESLPYLNFQSDIGESWQCVLGHRRLSILDLSVLGHCPMTDDTARYWITYNGEIYNYLEIKKELEILGVRFISNSDTEVVLKAFIQWGKNCVDRFNGMWGLVIYDRTTKKLFASRDRFGVKPFYYVFNEKRFAFASEQKALVQSGVVEKEINSIAVAEYLQNAHFELQEEGFFKNVFELMPGCILELDVQQWKLEKQRIYDLKYKEGLTEFSPKTEAKYIEEVACKIADAVKFRMRSDVPVGSSLSGGIDSSVIVGLMRKFSDQPIHTFTASSSVQELDETDYTKQVIDFNQTIAHFVTPNQNDLEADILKLTYSQDIPLFSTSTYAQYRVMELAKKNGVKVLLDGQGGDELFAGYMPHHVNHWMDFLKSGDFSTTIKEMSASNGLLKSSSFFIKQYLRFYSLPKLSSSIKPSIFSEYQYIAKSLIQDFEYQPSYAGEMPKDMNGMLKFEFQTRLKGYLKCEDRCSMWHSVEARTPFADDHRLIEAVFNMEGQYKIKQGVKKHLLKMAGKPVLPEKVFKRTDKMGYVTPNNDWIKQMRPYLKSFFKPDLKPFINVDQILKDFDVFFDQTHKVENGRMYKFIGFALWYDQFFRQSNPPN